MIENLKKIRALCCEAGRLCENGIVTRNPEDKTLMGLAAIIKLQSALNYVADVLDEAPQWRQK